MHSCQPKLTQTIERPPPVTIADSVPLMKIHNGVVLLCATALTLSGCSSESNEAAGIDQTQPTVVDVQESDAPPTAEQETDATAVAEDLQQASSTVTQIVTITEDNDPNDKIGRPNGYSSAAVLYDSQVTCDDLGVDCGMTIEEFPNEASARDRATHIQSSLMNMPALGSEWNYLRGPVLLRITGNLNPSVAAVYAEQFGGEEFVLPPEE